MCSNTGNYRAPARDNFCDTIGTTESGSGDLGFCTLLGPAGGDMRTDLCSVLGGGGTSNYGYNYYVGPNGMQANNSGMLNSIGSPLSEYYYPSGFPPGGSDCGYDDFHAGQYFGSSGLAGCCNGPCAIIGGGYVCTRQSTLGNPILCCLRDLHCNPGPDNPANPPSRYDGLDACFETGANYVTNSTFTDANHDVEVGRVCTCPASNRDQTSITVDPSGVNAVSYYGQGMAAPTAPEKPCFQIMNDWCTGIDPISGKPLVLSDGTYDRSWRNGWLGTTSVTANCNVENSRTSQSFHQPCFNYLYKLMYKGTPQQCVVNASNISTYSSISPSSEGYQLAQQLFSNMLSKYALEGGNLAASENEVGDTQLNSVIATICQTTPGLCTSALYNLCATTTTNDLIRNAALQTWCGCYMPANEYATYTDTYQVNPECTPTCNQSGVIPLVGADGITAKTCLQSACIIDHVAIELANAKVGSSGQGISFSQICGSCGLNSVCNCTMRNLTFIAANAQVGTVNFSQHCGNSAQCYRETTNANGSISTVPVPCDQSVNYNPFAAQATATAAAVQRATTLEYVKIAAIVIGVVLILVILYLVLKAQIPFERNTTVYSRTGTSQPVSEDIGTERLSGLNIPSLPSVQNTGLASSGLG